MRHGDGATWYISYFFGDIEGRCTRSYLPYSVTIWGMTVISGEMATSLLFSMIDVRLDFYFFCAFEHSKLPRWSLGHENLNT